jgi:predicted GTPase
VKLCKSKVMAKMKVNRPLIKQFRKEYEQYTGQKHQKQTDLCKKAKNVYEPNGLMADVPPVWQCKPDAITAEVMKKLGDQEMSVDTSGDAFNIVLVGRTGAGKSYFANALLGYLKPGQKEGVPFSAKDTSKSVTQNVKANSGNLFGGLYNKELGVPENVKINVFDTPGFSDANIENIVKNKLLIASSLKNDIHMIIFLVPSPRFDAANQLSLQMLNEWTAGKMWPNLLIIKGRTQFNDDEQASRQSNNNNIAKMKNTDAVVEFLTARANNKGEEPWTAKDIVDGKVVSRNLQRADYEKVQMNLLNMAQHRECYTSEDHTPSDKCWPLPLFDKFGQYEVEYDYDTFEETIKDHDTKKVFIEEAKEFWRILQDMKTHPVIPSAQIMKVELEQDAADYQALLDKAGELNEKIEKASNAGPELTEKLANCDNSTALKTAIANCPKWKPWGAWSDICEQPDMCGLQFKKRLRTGCEANGVDIEIGACEFDYSTSHMEKEVCDGLRECNNNAELLEQMEKTRQADKAQQQQMMQQMLETFQKQQNDQSASMREMMAKQQESTNAMIKEMNSRPVNVQYPESGGGCLSRSDYATSCNGTKVPMSNLSREDFVLSYNFEKSTISCEKIVAIMEHEETNSVKMIEVVLTSNHIVHLTPNHIIYVIDENTNSEKAIPARQIQNGDAVMSSTGVQYVVEANSIDMGPISPQVASGTIIANDVVVSTLTEADYHIARPMISIIDRLMDQYLPKDTNGTFKRVVEKSRKFFGSCKREDIQDLLTHAFGTKKDFHINSQIVTEFVDVCFATKSML